MSKAATQVLLAERAAMCDTFGKFGPDAPTLCEGWNTLDLAAHLVAREARSDAAIGLVVPFLAGHLQRVMDKYRAKGYEPLVAMLRTGPPWMHRTGPLAVANVNENFVHHEDVRRPAGEPPRQLDPEMDQILWKMLGFGMSKKAIPGVALTLRSADGRDKTVTKEGSAVTLSGDIGELALYLSGRKDAAVVTFDGADDAVAIVQNAKFGV
ncbi:MAG: TIGR03085 family metal-binding protein [Acidimicrobiia bacterium]